MAFEGFPAFLSDDAGNENRKMPTVSDLKRAWYG
jgi:hypothetical protein